MGESSKSIRRCVQAVRDMQQQRFAHSQPDIVCKADMRVREIRQFCKPQDEGGVLSLSKYQSLTWAAMGQVNLSIRAYHHILKLVCMIADLAGSKDIRPTYLAD